jgi:hypothetical protein
MIGVNSARRCFQRWACGLEFGSMQVPMPPRKRSLSKLQHQMDNLGVSARGGPEAGFSKYS